MNNIITNVNIDLDELAEDVYQGCSAEELINFILNLDERTANVGFSKKLLVKLVQSLRKDDVKIKLKINGEKF